MDPTSRIPSELVTSILEHVIASTNHDPTDQWTRLRHISGSIMQYVEQHFQQYWLPKVVITAYIGPHRYQDYRYDEMETRSEDADTDVIARFVQIEEFSIEPHLLTQTWADDSLEDRRVFIRLGEGYVNEGLCGGSIVNDTPLPELRVSDDGSTIAFDWRQMFSQLLVEQKLMKQIGEDLLSKSVDEWKSEHNWEDDQPVSDETYVELLALKVKQQRRVQAMKHRIRKHDPEMDPAIVFHWYSIHLHEQPVAKERPTDRSGCCWACSRRENPDIFEIVQQEESVLPLLPGWEEHDWRSLHRLAAEEFGWSCCTACNKPNDRAWQQKRAKEWMGNQDAPLPDIVRDMTKLRRWDLLG